MIFIVIPKHENNFLFLLLKITTLIIFVYIHFSFMKDIIIAYYQGIQAFIPPSPFELSSVVDIVKYGNDVVFDL